MEVVPEKVAGLIMDAVAHAATIAIQGALIRVVPDIAAAMPIYVQSLVSCRRN